MVQGIGNGPGSIGFQPPNLNVPMPSPTIPQGFQPFAGNSFGLGPTMAPNIQADTQFAAQGGAFSSVAQDAKAASMGGAGANPQAMAQAVMQMVQELSQLIQQMTGMLQGGMQQAGGPQGGMPGPQAAQAPGGAPAPGAPGKAGPGKRAKKKRKAMKKARQGGGKAKGQALGNLAAQQATQQGKGLAARPGKGKANRPGAAGKGQMGAAGSASDGPGGFLFKPQSENGGKLVVLTSEKDANNVQGVTLRDGNGNVLEQGRSSGFANGGREHFRFKKAGGAYPNNLVVEIAYKDGRKEMKRIPNPGKRYD